MNKYVSEKLRLLYSKYRREGMTFEVGYLIFKERARALC